MREKEIYRKETLRITTLSPVHIGTGIKFGNWDFYSGNGYIYVISLDKLIENLTESQQEELTNHIENSKESLTNFINNKNMEHLLNDIYLYKIRLTDFSKRIFGIWEEIKHPQGLYIPASTLKGTIRTAVLYSLLKENKDKYIFDIENNQIVLKDKNGNILAKGLNDKDKNSLQNFLDKEFFGENQSKDVFKYLKISDSKVINGFNNLVCRKIYVANTTKFGIKLPDGHIKNPKHPEYYETIEKETLFPDIQISFLVDENFEKFISPKYKRTLQKIKNWKKCLYEFSQDLIDTEIAFWENENVEKMMEQAYSKSPHKYLIDIFNKDKVIKQLKEIRKLNNEKTPVIRIGKLTGYFTHSIGILLASQDKPYNINQYGKIINKKAKNWLFPLTRRLTLDNQTLGWCLISKQQNKDKETNANQKKSKEKIEKVDEEAIKKLQAKLRGEII